MSEDLEQKEIEHLLENREYGYEPSDVERIPLSDIKPDLMNANRHTERGTYQLKNSIEKFGFAEAGTLDANNKIIAGNNRTEVAVDVLDPESVRVIEHDGKTPIYIKLPHVDLETVEGRELAIALNRTAQVGIEFDPDMLRQLDDMGVELGDWFTDLELDDMGIDIDEPEPAEDAGADVDRAAELQEQWGTETGQLWVLPSRDGKGEHRLLVGDCTVKENVERVMGGDRADAVITDPPYSVSYAEKNKFLNNLDKGNRVQSEIAGDHMPTEEASKKIWLPSFINCALFMNKVSSFYCFMPQGGDQMMMMMMMMMEAGIKPKHELIWLKNNHVLGRSDYNYKHEPIMYGWLKDGTHKFYGEFQTSVIEFDKPVSSKLHPTMKPVELIEKLIGNCTLGNGILYEPFAGSGTTIIACENLNRYCRAIELSPAYCAVILQRYTDTFGVSPYLSS